MTIVVGLAGDDRNKAVVTLAAQLARSLGRPLVVAIVVPKPWWIPGPGRGDAEYIDAVEETATSVLEAARDWLGDLEAEFVVHHAGSTASGLLQVVDEQAGSLLVLGSSREGRYGHVAVGSVTGRLVHSSPVPVALAPRGYRGGAADRVLRVTCAFSGNPGSEAILGTAAELATAAGAPLRVASFGLRSRTVYTAGVGSRMEDDVTAAWRERALAAQEEATAGLGDVETVIAEGSDWESALEAVDWTDGDLLAVGSSPSHALKTVFLGSQATRIVRHSSVPVVVLPRG